MTDELAATWWNGVTMTTTLPYPGALHRGAPAMWRRAVRGESGYSQSHWRKIVKERARAGQAAAVNEQFVGGYFNYANARHEAEAQDRKRLALESWLGPPADPMRALVYLEEQREFTMSQGLALRAMIEAQRERGS